MASQPDVSRDGGLDNESGHDADIYLAHDNSEIEEEQPYLINETYELDEVYAELELPYIEDQPYIMSESYEPDEVHVEPELPNIDETDLADTSIAADENHDAPIEAKGYTDEQEARLLARNAGISSSTHALLAYFQTHFFESRPETTLYTQRVKSGDVHGAKLIRIKRYHAANKFSYCYVWFGKDDIINDIAKEWAIILWPWYEDKMSVTMHTPFFKHDGARLLWCKEFDGVKMGDTIVYVSD